MLGLEKLSSLMISTLIQGAYRVPVYNTIRITVTRITPTLSEVIISWLEEQHVIVKICVAYRDSCCLSRHTLLIKIYVAYNICVACQDMCCLSRYALLFKENILGFITLHSSHLSACTVG